ncbi:hypothetical protein SISSUDRAFT_705367 [Sistotremastrum suecicum HHB10207 ss-3]|uniref:Uncharacterized protein n=1 Tax=Sistotremastrum suecicum HHB10207 ss-3 TaxID=1314776 RepID=A0A166DTK0_9AGAM|nr:hypothetical protein SISSUDRAFT_705367 [Sistotremastrum suecicum HHB10207 ss-3]
MSSPEPSSNTDVGPCNADSAAEANRARSPTLSTSPPSVYTGVPIDVDTIETARPHLRAFLNQEIQILKLYLDVPSSQEEDELLEQIFAEDPSLNPRNDQKFKIDIWPDGLLVLQYRDIKYAYAVSGLSSLLCNASTSVDQQQESDLSQRLGYLHVVAIGGRHPYSRNKSFMPDLIISVEQRQNLDFSKDNPGDLDPHTSFWCEVSTLQSPEEGRKKLAVACSHAMASNGILINLDQSPDGSVKSASFEQWRLVFVLRPTFK